MTDEEGPVARKARVTLHNLATWDVGELQEYIGELESEVVRARAAIDRKQGHRQAADAFFRTPGDRS